MALRSPVIALVGRPNVGKSTLFNRIAGQRIAVVEDFPGVTRDRNYAFVEKNYSIPFYVVDTGGFELESEDVLQRFVAEQVRAAIDEADILFVLFDGRAGLHPGDKDVVDLLRGAKQKVYFLVNKCDGVEQAALKVDFYELGVDDLIDVSAEQGRGVTQLVETALQGIENYDSLVASFKARKEAEQAAMQEAKLQMELALKEARLLAGDEEEDEDDFEEEEIEEEEVEENPTFAPVFIPETGESAAEYEKMNRLRAMPASKQRIVEDIAAEPDSYTKIDTIRVAIVGRPNVGKSTFLNKVLGEQRAITSPIAGTTRDSLDVTITRNGQQYCLIDTAGIRKKARVTDRIEKFSVFRSLQALSSCDVCLLVLDATTGPVEQDAKVLGIAHEEGKGVVIAINKWDLIEKDHKSVTKFKEQIKDVFKFTPYAPILFISAMTGQRCPKVLDVVTTVAEERAKRVPTGRLNRILKRSFIRHVPPVYRGRAVKLYYGAQIMTSPPRFALFFNYPKAIHFSYLRYLKNSIREEFGFDGTDIKLALKKRESHPREN